MWTDFFTEFLNIASCNDLPDLAKWRQRFQEFFFRHKAARFSSIVADIARTLP